MAKRKTEFMLQTTQPAGFVGEKFVDNGTISIVGQSPREDVYVTIDIPGKPYHFIKGSDSDLETFALNILKALKSKHLNP